MASSGADPSTAGSPASFDPESNSDIEAALEHALLGEQQLSAQAHQRGLADGAKTAPTAAAWETGVRLGLAHGAFVAHARTVLRALLVLAAAPHSDPSGRVVLHQRDLRALSSRTRQSDRRPPP